jgi:hypothetical protein
MRINVNGREYKSIDEMPPDVREQYTKAMSMLADKDGNGVPDIFERGNVSVSSEDDERFVTSVQTESRYVINGKHYSRLEDVPPETRKLLRNPSTATKIGLPERPGGLTIQLTWVPLLAVLAAAAVTALLARIVARAL